FSSSEQSVLNQLSRFGEIGFPQSKHFVSTTHLTSRSVGKIFEKLTRKGVIEKVDSRFRISDPLLSFYLKSFR
ncbi:MAG: hypothetical protein AAB066_02840, partial [Candidatus Margulisiibacteriota bacterium]